MKNYICLSMLMLLALAAPAAAHEETIARLINPIFLVPQPPPLPPQVSLDNMRLGCKASTKSNIEQDDCLAQIQKMSELAALTNQESLYAHLMAARHETKWDAIRAFVISYKNTQRIKKMREQLLKHYPYVKFYVAPRQRLNI